jgi:hypothetical protein
MQTFLATLLSAFTLSAFVSATGMSLKPRDCGFSHCDCKQFSCFLTFCFDDHVNPWILIDNAMSPNYGDDCGSLENWDRVNPAEWCDNGLRKATGQFAIWRKWPSLSPDFTVNYKNTTDVPNQGTVSGTCNGVQKVECKCHGKYDKDKHDCSKAC